MLQTTRLKVAFLCTLKATVEPMQIDTGLEDGDASRVMVESTTLVNI